MNIKYFYILCEGQTEESFVNNVLYDYLTTYNIYVEPIIVSTKRTGSKKYTGGSVPYEKMKKEIKNLCANKNYFVTTIFDYYGLGKDVPGKENPIGNSIYEKVCYIEEKLLEDINQNNFIPNIIIHEFEGLLFSDPSKFSCINDKEALIKSISEIKNKFDSPEHINDSVNTAPSKRIQKIYPEYNKILHGTLIAKDIGIDSILAVCKHFEYWITNLKK